MKMFKRFAAALLVGVMVLAMLTACGGGSAPASLAERAQSLAEQGIAAGLGNGGTNDKNLTEMAYNALGNVDKDGKLNLNSVSPKEDDEIAKYEKYIEAIEAGEKAEACTIVSYTIFEGSDYDEVTNTGSVMKVTSETLNDVFSESKRIASESLSDEEGVTVRVGVAVREVGGVTYIGYAISTTFPEVPAQNAE